MLYAFSYGQPSLDSKTKETYFLNRIKNQESWDYKYSGSKPAKRGNRTSLKTFTTSGEVSQVITYNASGQVLHIEKYKYDRNGNRTEYTRMSGESSNKPAYQKLSVYNEHGKISEESGFDGVENFKNLYTYNDYGDLAEIRYFSNNILKEKRIFHKKGNETSVMIYNSSGNLSSKLILRYDDHDNLVEESVYGVNQDELEKKLYNYDDNQNLKEEAKYRMDRIILTTTYNYNPSGDLLEIHERIPGSDTFLKRSFDYDSKGNLVEIKWRRNSNEAFNTMIYTYDGKGICTTVDTYYPDTKYRVLTRYTYAYY